MDLSILRMRVLFLWALVAVCVATDSDPGVGNGQPIDFGPDLSMNGISSFYNASLGAEKPYNLTVGVVGTFFESNGGFDDSTIEYFRLLEYNERVVPFLLGVNAINSQSALLPNHRIEVVLKDDELSGQKGFFRMLELHGLDWGPEAGDVTYVDAVFGSLASGVTKSIASATANFHTPTIGCTSTNADLSDKDTYSSYARTVSSDATQACAWAMLAKHFEWEKVAVMATKTEYGLGLASDFVECAKTYGITIVADISFEQGETDHTTQISTLKNSEVFVIFLAMHGGDVNNLGASLKVAGMMGTQSPYTYIGGDAIPPTRDDTIMERFPGLLWTLPFAPVESNAQNDALMDSWLAATGEEMADHMTFAAICYDAAFVLANYFDDFISNSPDGPDPDLRVTASNYTEFLRSMPPMDGASGLVAFDQNLDPATSRWSIFNNGEKAIEMVGKIEIESETVEFYHDLDPDNFSELYWPTGLSGFANAPSAEIIYTDNWLFLATSTRRVYIIATAITFLLSLVLVALSIRWRARPIIKMSAYRINILTVIGLNLTLIADGIALFDERKYDADALSRACTARLFVTVVGFSLFVGTIFSKIYRVHKIFNAGRLLKMKVKVITDSQLIGTVILYVLTNVIIVTVFATTWPFERRTVYGATRPTENPIVWEQDQIGECHTDQGSTVNYILMGFNGLVLIVGSIWAFETRKVYYPGLNDSVQVGFVMMLVFVVSCFVFGISHLAHDNPDVVFLMRFFGTFLTAWVTLFVIFVPKYYAILTGPEAENAWVTSRGSLTRRTNGGKSVGSHSNGALEASINSSFSGPKPKTSPALAYETALKKVSTIQLATIKDISKSFTEAEIMSDDHPEEKPSQPASRNPSQFLTTNQMQMNGEGKRSRDPSLSLPDSELKVGRHSPNPSSSLLEIDENPILDERKPSTQVWRRSLPPLSGLSEASRRRTVSCPSDYTSGQSDASADAPPHPIMLPNINSLPRERSARDSAGTSGSPTIRILLEKDGTRIDLTGKKMAVLRQLVRETR